MAFDAVAEPEIGFKALFFAVAWLQRTSREPPPLWRVLVAGMDSGGMKRIAQWALSEAGPADRIHGAAPGSDRYHEVDKRFQVGLPRSVRPDRPR